MIRRFISYLRNRHSDIYKLLLVCFSITLIVYALPKQGKFRYDISNLRGKPWPYENLIAPFDFSINKSPEELEDEKKEIKKGNKKYFSYDDAVAEKNKEKFQALIQTAQELTEVKKQALIKKGLLLLDSIYTHGIIDYEYNPGHRKAEDISIFLVQNNVEVEKNLSDFFTIQQAVEYIDLKLKKEGVLDKVIISALESCLVHNITFDKTTTDKVLEQSLGDISPTKGGIYKDQIIISRGEIVTPEKFQVLASLRDSFEVQSFSSSSYFYVLIGQVFIISLCLFVLGVFLFLFRKDTFQDNRKIACLLLLFVIMTTAAAVSQRFENISLYALPFCILPIIVRAFFDIRTALFTHLIFTLLMSIMASDRFEFIFVELLAGLVALFSIVSMRNRSQILVSALVIFVMYSVSYTALVIAQDGQLSSLSPNNYFYFGISAFLTLFFYPLIFVLEKIFGFVSDVSLLELSDTNNPLLRDLAIKAPGTFQHSLQVANLAEDAIYKIGGNQLLVRTGALYHDIGKIDMPLYFIENQVSGINPHDELSHDESAAIIIGHVLRGIEKAKEHKLPEQIIDFIRTHHGTTMTSYFYRNFKKDHPDEEIDTAKFTYPGPVPFSKETAVLMMADSVEAASRSLKNYDAGSIDNLVEYIINGQVQQNQFVNADITYRDITLIKRLFKKKLQNIYHVRVEYPR